MQEAVAEAGRHPARQRPRTDPVAAAQVRAARGGGRWSHPLSRRAAAAPAACSSPCCGRLGSRPGRLRRRCHLLSPRAAAQPWSASLSPLPLSTSPTPHTHCRPRAAKPEIRLTPGKGLQDLTCTVEDLIDQGEAGAVPAAGGGRVGVAGAAAAAPRCVPPSRPPSSPLPCPTHQHAAPPNAPTRCPAAPHNRRWSRAARWWPLSRALARSRSAASRTRSSHCCRR